MSLEYIRDTYNVPAKLGGRVRYTYGNGCDGTITGSRNAHILVWLDGAEEARAFHPTWEMQYLDATLPPPDAAHGPREWRLARNWHPKKPALYLCRWFAHPGREVALLWDGVQWIGPDWQGAMRGLVNFGMGDKGLADEWLEDSEAAARAAVQAEKGKA